MAWTNNHGGTIVATARAMGVPMTELIDMSSNLSPLGMAPGLKAVLTQALPQLGHLPEIDNQGLELAFARHGGCAVTEVVAGPGSTEFIFALPEVVNCQRAVIVQPTYNDYAVACDRQGLEIYPYFLKAADDFCLDLADLGQQLRSGDLLFLCNPNNPTGQVLASADIYNFVQEHPQVCFVVDESYLPFIRAVSLVGMGRLPNLFILCSSSKIYGIPGLRLGFLVASAAMLAPFRERMLPWAVNRLAQVAGEYLLAQGEAYVTQVQDYLVMERANFVAALAALPGLRVFPGQTNFILCHLEGEYDAPWLAAELVRSRIMIRNCVNFTGLDKNYFRVSLQAVEQNNYFLQELANRLTFDA